MLKAITLREFDIIFRDFNGNRDYNMVVSFIPKESDHEIFGSKPRRFLVPYYFGVMDTTITDDDYNCIVFIEDESKSLIGQDYIESLFVFFVKKFENFRNEIIPQESAKLPQSVEERLGSKFRTFKGPGENTAINIGPDSIEIVAGNSKLIISSKGISIYGDITDFNMPSKSQGGLIKETNILRLFPKAFVPPFSLPDYMPNMDLLTRVSGLMNVLKAMREVL